MIGECNAWVCVIANGEALALGKNIYEKRRVKKYMRSLLKRFAYKVITIKENKNIKAMKLEKLRGSLRMFEMYLNKKKVLLPKMPFNTT